MTVFHPPEPGRHAHATFGFGGLIGALAGMSAAGLTTHEANLESNRDSFRGFPWLLRLRYLLERADNLASAEDVWRATNNTVGCTPSLHHPTARPHRVYGDSFDLTSHPPLL